MKRSMFKVSHEFRSIILNHCFLPCDNFKRSSLISMNSEFEKEVQRERLTFNANWTFFH